MSSNLDRRHTETITDSCRPSVLQDEYENFRMQDASNLRTALIQNCPTDIDPDDWQFMSNELICSLVQVCSLMDCVSIFDFSSAH